jgi:transcriptional regulator with XRE-family HTH domain
VKKRNKLAKIYGGRLWAQRKKHNETLEQFGKRIGTGPTAVCHLEAGDFVPGGETLVKQSKRLKVSTDYLLGLKAR